MRTKKRFLGILLTLTLALGLVPGMRMTAYAAGTTWSESFTTDGGTIDGGVTMTADITLTVPAGKTLTVNGGIDGGKMLIVTGGGTLNVNGQAGVNGQGAPPASVTMVPAKMEDQAARVPMVPPAAPVL